MRKIILEQRVTFLIFFFEIYFTRWRRPKLLDLLFVWPWKNYEELVVPCCKQLPPVRAFTIDFSIPNVMTIDIGIERTRCRDSLIHSWWCNHPSIQPTNMFLLLTMVTLPMMLIGLLTYYCLRFEILFKYFKKVGVLCSSFGHR